MFRFGRQIDVRPIRSTDFSGNAPVTERHVAAYIANYATKGAETTTGTLDRRLRLLAELASHDISDHARRMIHTAWSLGAQPQHAHLRLRQWPPCSASEATSPPAPATTPPPWPTSAPNAPPGEPRASTGRVISHWQYAGTGLLPELAHLSDLLTARQPTRPETSNRNQRPGHPGDRAGHAAGHPVGHSNAPLTGIDRAGATT